MRGVVRAGAGATGTAGAGFGAGVTDTQPAATSRSRAEARHEMGDLIERRSCLAPEFRTVNPVSPGFETYPRGTGYPLDRRSWAS